MKQPVDHIIRPNLPWRPASPITECGYDASKVKTLTRDEFFRRLKDYGQQRTALLTCMTCMQTAERWKPWDEDPVEALGREVNRQRFRAPKPERLYFELLAIAQLIENHRDEFDEMVRSGEWIRPKLAVEKEDGPGKRVN